MSHGKSKSHPGRGWLGKESREQRRPKRKSKQKPKKDGRRPYVG